MTSMAIDREADAFAEVTEALERLGLLRGRARFTPLSGGVSSDIWKVETGERVFCVKRARPRLAVEAVWEVPVERNHSEAEFLRVAAIEVPRLAPDLIAEDRERGLIVLSYLDPAEWMPWKAELLAGRADPAAAAGLGEALGRLVRRTGHRTDLARRFATDDLFQALRLEPYLGAAARRHPDLAEPLNRLIETTAGTRMALVHGDVSPKNILVAADGAFRLLDAECAWYGDPAFDLAFCLNHLLLKCIWTPASTDDFLTCFTSLTEAYLGKVDWEPANALEQRTAALLPGLLLARIDGASPVEYITQAPDKNRVRRAATAALQHPPTQLRDLPRLYREEIQK